MVLLFLRILITTTFLFVLTSCVAVALFPEVKLEPAMFIIVTGLALSVAVVLIEMVRKQRSLLLLIIGSGLIALPFILLDSHNKAKKQGNLEKAKGYEIAIYVHLGVYACLGLIGVAIWYRQSIKYGDLVYSSSVSLASKAS